MNFHEFLSFSIFYLVGFGTFFFCFVPSLDFPIESGRLLLYWSSMASAAFLDIIRDSGRVLSKMYSVSDNGSSSANNKEYLGSFALKTLFYFFSSSISIFSVFLLYVAFFVFGCFLEGVFALGSSGWGCSTSILCYVGSSVSAFFDFFTAFLDFGLGYSAYWLLSLLFLGFDYYFFSTYCAGFSVLFWVFFGLGGDSHFSSVVCVRSWTSGFDFFGAMTADSQNYNLMFVGGFSQLQYHFIGYC